MLRLHRGRLHYEGLRPLKGQPRLSDAATRLLLLEDPQVCVCGDAVVMSGRLNTVNDHVAGLRRSSGDLQVPRGCMESKAQSEIYHVQQTTKKKILLDAG